jgi:hypothetical protein
MPEHGGNETMLEFVLGCDADVAQDGAGEFGKETLDGGESEFETVCGLTGESGCGLFGDVCGMIVEDQLDRRMGRIGVVEKLEEFDEFATAMAILDQRMDLPGRRRNDHAFEGRNGGTGAIAILSAGDCVNLLPFALLVTRLGGH